MLRPLQPPSISLNYIQKKHEAERIDKENQKIMERIVARAPHLSAKKLEQEF